MVFLKISQNSQENTCVRLPSLIKLRPATLLKKKLWHGGLPVNFDKFLRTPSSTNTASECVSVGKLYETKQFCLNAVVYGKKELH